MRIITRCWALLAMFCGLMMAATITNAQDAPYQYPIGTETDFIMSGERTFEFDGMSIHNSYEGDLSLETIDNGQEETSSTTFLLRGFNASGYDEKFGAIALTADLATTEEAGLTSSITAYTAENPLPARGSIEFYARITITHTGDEQVVYQSKDPITLVGQINEWGGEDQAIEFYQSGETVFFNVDDPNKLIVLKDVKSNVVIVPPVKGPCQDPCCHTDAISLNTGFNHAVPTLYPVGSGDAYWTIIADQCTTRAVPRAARVITRMSGWAVAQPNTQWIGANSTAVDECLGQVTYQKCFCLCQASTLTFNMSILVDDQADVYLDGVYMGSTPDLAFTTPTKLNFVRALKAGTHCIEVIVRNNYKSHAGLNIQGSIQGANLLKVTCCGQTPPPPGPCETNNLTMGTNNSWTLMSGPADGKPYPRCADIIKNPHPAWHGAVPGSSWIGPNSGGTSLKPGNKPYVYVYRKCFCVELPGTYVITITSMADDAGEIYLNNVLIGTTGGYGAPVTKTYTVALSKGCNCLDFKVKDIGFVVTGLDALVNIKGPRLMKEECCSCSSCSSKGLPPTDTPLKLSMQGGEGQTDVEAIAAAPEAHPMLIGIPDETGGTTTVHYVLDKETKAEVALYRASGERVMVLDEGTRAYGAHQVSLATKDLPAGSYRLELVYGEEALSVPVEVQ